MRGSTKKERKKERRDWILLHESKIPRKLVHHDESMINSEFWIARGTQAGG